MMNSLFIVCFFTFVIHLSESIAYSMRLAGVRTRQIAIALSFVMTTLFISRLSNMFQAPLLAVMVDKTILIGTQAAFSHLIFNFRIVIFSAFLGSMMGAFLTPTIVFLFQKAILRFLHRGSVPLLAIQIFHPRNFMEIIRAFRVPTLESFKHISLKNIPKTFLILNILVTSIYTIGVLCSLLAGLYLPQYRSTAIQLSGLVNGIATIFLTLIVDPSGARITDQAAHGLRPENDVRSVVFFLLLGRIFGILILSQILFMPFSLYIGYVAAFLANTF